MPSETQELLQYAQYITWPVAIVAAAYILKPIWASLAGMIKQKTDNTAIQHLQEFQHTAETNHFTDLDHLIEQDKRHTAEIEDIRRILSKHGNDIAYIRGRLENRK